MQDRSQIAADFRRYADLIRPLLAPANSFQPTSEAAATVQVERGVMYAAAILDPKHPNGGSVDRLLELGHSQLLPGVAVVDRNGHARTVYRPLLVYCWLQSFGLYYESLPRSEFGRWEDSLRSWCDLLESQYGSGVGVQAAWIALTLHVAGKIFVRDAWTDLAADTFGKIARAQGDDGSFLATISSENPETRWYEELILLHAAASYAVQAEDRTVAAAVAKNSDFHQSEIQPDHATTQPWALFAFAWNRRARPLAEQILHSAAAHPTDLSLMLLADALYCTQLFLK